MAGVEVDVAELEEQGGGIGATDETSWIALLAEDEGLDVVGLYEFELAFCIVAKLRIRTAIDDHLSDGTCLQEEGRVRTEYGFGRAEGLDEVASPDGAYAADGVQDENGEEGRHRQR